MQKEALEFELKNKVLSDINKFIEESEIQNFAWDTEEVYYTKRKMNVTFIRDFEDEMESVTIEYTYKEKI